MNAKHAGLIETRDLATVWQKLAGSPKRVQINSVIQHVGKHGVLYARKGI